MYLLIFAYGMPYMVSMSYLFNIHHYNAVSLKTGSRPNANFVPLVVVITTTFHVTSDIKVGIMTTLFPVLENCVILERVITRIHQSF